MNDKFSIYNELAKLKSNLQMKFFENGRKPAICSDDVLKLLDRYKPTSLEDMRNINGIGEAFITKYGSYFLDVIKKYTSEKIEEISSEEKEILCKLENRLVNINRRNRLLYSGKINKDYGLDVLKYFSNPKEIEKFILSRDSSLLKLVDIENYDEQKLKTINKIIRQAEKIDIESGNKELYIAYPFIQGKFEKENFNAKAPLMLFPVEIVRNADFIFLKNDNSRDIIYNTTLILANNKFNGKNEVLPDNAIEEFESECYLKNMISYYENNKIFIKNNNSELEKFLETTVATFPEYKDGEFEVKRYMVLGLYSTYVTSMYEDFHKMIENKNITELIRDLLWGAASSILNIDGTYNENEIEEKEQKTEEKNILYINELDSSQEEVLEKINKYKSLVVQGPPGTGKSQTITSIVAQAILQGKNILMVSEKKTALDVIYSRLGYLSKFALILDDIENKDEFYTQVNGMISTLMSELSKLGNSAVLLQNYQNEIMTEINKIDENLKLLDDIGEKVYGYNDYETTMYNLYNKCKKFDFSKEKDMELYKFMISIDSEQISQLKYPELNEIYEKMQEKNLQKSIQFYLDVINDNNCVLNVKENLTDLELFEFKQNLVNLKKFLDEFNTYSFMKKIINHSKIKEKIYYIINNYFKDYDNKIYSYIKNETDSIIKFIDIYSEFISNKFIYDKLNYNEKEYVNLIVQIEGELDYSFMKANELIYNYNLFNHIIDFEKNNVDVLNYINNFDLIRSNINLAISNKKRLTYKLAELELLKNAAQLDGNNKISKIEEMCNRKRKMAINKFMSKYKLEMLDSIKIWLMTPEVVSDILPFNKDLFDLVIFDEASQLYVEKAIPAIYRAKKVVIAGDQKQLKPSSLGKGRILDEIDEDEISDGFLEYESLLDAANYKFRHTMLNYHYRSRYNELIAFSNYAFYHGKLMVTSEASAAKEKPIERIFVKNGRWIDKKNHEEANEVVNLVKKILNERKNNETLGVITFNASQMNLIEDILDKEMSKDQKFATMIMNEKNRTKNGENIGFFVKNIESVQGDERDIIIFCIGYAKNETGRVAINFGWLNQDGGENRLNVAISRAKTKIYVVTSIEPDELIVDSTKNNGPKLFKEYLRYAKSIDENNKELTESILLNLLDNNIEEKSQLSYDSVFEEEVSNALIKKGYVVQTQYGVGGYRIDLVVKTKDGKDNLIGIECDGRLYHSSKFARERDYHRQKYLESRGWNIYRIWSTNWWKNPNLEIKKLDDYIKNIIVKKDD